MSHLAAPVAYLANSSLSYSPLCAPPSLYRQTSYYNLEGSVNSRVARNLTYGPGAEAFFELLENWRKAGAMEGYEVKYAAKL